MFASRLRRISDVRLLPLTAVLLLSACALHRPDAGPDGAPTPAGDTPSLPHVDLPDFDIPVPDVTVPDLAAAEPTTPEITRWVTHAPSFLLVSTSEVASDLATSALQPTSDAFARLFGAQAPRIAVAVVDTSKGRPFVDVPEPPAGMTSIVIVGSGLTGPDSAVTAEVLTSELRFEAATAWLFDYSAEWRESLGLTGVRPLPDWMHLALLRLLTDPNASIDVRPVRSETSMPLATLFIHRVSEREADAALSVVRASSGIAHDDSSEWQRGLAFVNESTSLLAFLRHTTGERVFANIIGAAAAGLSMPEILRRLPEPMTTAELNVAFRAWSNAKVTASRHD
jgi:hypothetical protein